MHASAEENKNEQIENENMYVVVVVVVVVWGVYAKCQGLCAKGTKINSLSFIEMI